MADREETCAVCGYVGNLGAVAQHHLIPASITMEAGVPESATMDLCCNCHYELQSWYRMKVANVTYDSATRRFREKSWEEKVRDYESTLAGFKQYKSEQRKPVRKRRQGQFGDLR